MQVLPFSPFFPRVVGKEVYILLFGGFSSPPPPRNFNYYIDNLKQLHPPPTEIIT